MLPKRATVFQSIVNMKLLKKKADQSKKNVILVTSEAGLMPLAGAVGMHVAKSLQAKPEIPAGPDAEDIDDGPVSLADEAKEADDEPDIDNKKPIGELAGAAALGAAAASKHSPEDTIQIDNDAISDPMGLNDIDKETKAGKPKKGKKANKKAKGLDGKPIKVPDFNKFRKWLLIGGAAAIALIIFWIFGFHVWSKATIIIQTNTSNQSSVSTITLSQADGNVNTATGIVPAKLQSQTKSTTSSPVNTTGTKTIGTSATGPITITNPCTLQGSTSSVNVPSGTQFTDNSGNVYNSNGSVTVPGFSINKGKCNPGVASVNVTAAGVGTGYNNSSNSTSYNPSDGDISTFNIVGGPMTGGSSNNVQVVATADVTAAAAQITTPNSSQMKSQLESSLKSEGYMPIPATFVAGTPVDTPSATVGSQANTVTVTQTVNYTMYGAKQSDLDAIVTTNVNQQINPSTQSILDTGVTTASYSVVSTTSSSATVTMQATATIGPKISAKSIASQSAGVPSGDIKNTIGSIPGVTNVIVKYSPFWVSATPKNVNKIHVVIEKSNGDQP